jgi:hypothetical protein
VDVSRLEERLRQAMAAGSTHVEPATDLFARVQLGIDADRQRRRVRRRVGAIAASVAATAGVAIALLIISNEGEMDMDWWIFELIVLALLVALALVLGPFIKRFGRSYAADVFRSNPSTGKSFIVLTDFAYYLIFGAYILFSSKIERPDAWSVEVGANQVQNGVIRVGGILLIIGVLHGVNLVLLPVIGRLLTLNRRLDQQMRDLADRDLSDHDLDQPDIDDDR